MKNMREFGIISFALFAITLQTVFLSGCSIDENLLSQKAEHACNLESLPQLPDVTITSVTQETEGVPHCKVAGVIGPEIHFELLLPEEWNGKFVMGGGGGFVGSVVNVSLLYGSLQRGRSYRDSAFSIL